MGHDISNYFKKRNNELNDDNSNNTNNQSLKNELSINENHNTHSINQIITVDSTAITITCLSYKKKK